MVLSLDFFNSLLAKLLTGKHWCVGLAPWRRIVIARRIKKGLCMELAHWSCVWCFWSEKYGFFFFKCSYDYFKTYLLELAVLMELWSWHNRDQRCVCMCSVQSYSLEGSAFGLVTCCHFLKILYNFFTEGPTLVFWTQFHKLHSWSWAYCSMRRV